MSAVLFFPYKTHGEMFTRASILYRRCVDAGIRVSSPADWVDTAADMCRFWEQYSENINKTPPHIRAMLVGNAFTDYMEFLYNMYKK